MVNRPETVFGPIAQPLSKAHLSPQIDAFYLEVSNPTYSFILLGIALVVLLIACTNFMALSVGRSVVRAKEVGTRKALGASRSQVASQFWGEAVVLSLLASTLGLALANMALPVFNLLADKELVLSFSAPAILGVVLLALLVGLLAGAYPAAILSGMRPSVVLGGGGSGRQGSTFTRAVIVFQFAAAIALITTSLIMYRQLEFVADRDLGFTANEVLVLPLQADDQAALEEYDRFAGLALSSPAIVESSPSSSAFAGSWSRTVLVENEASHIAYTNYIGPSFLQTMGMDLVEGRNLSSEIKTDSEHAILVNQALVENLGWEEPIGRSLERWPDVQVVGVVRDFNNLSLHQEVQPMILHMSEEISAPRYAMVRFRTDQTARALADLEQAWALVAPGAAFQPEFLDQRLQQLYESERRWQKIAGFAALLAVLISCLGLFGVLVGVAFLIGSPAAYFLADRWLESFAYRWTISPAVFLATFAIALGVAMVTVSFQAVSAALGDPTETLRHE
ncbi:MAG: putative ABC transport system permease protein [Rhodothermales bacterium]